MVVEAPGSYYPAEADWKKYGGCKPGFAYSGNLCYPTSANAVPPSAEERGIKIAEERKPWYQPQNIAQSALGALAGAATTVATGFSGFFQDLKAGDSVDTYNTAANKQRMADLANQQLAQKPGGLPEAVIEWLKAHPGETIAAAIAALGIGAYAATRTRKGRRKSRRSTRKGRRSRRFTRGRKLKFGSKAWRKKYMHKRRHGRSSRRKR